MISMHITYTRSLLLLSINKLKIDKYSSLFYNVRNIAI
jgi:hypothetical protein